MTEEEDTEKARQAEILEKLQVVHDSVESMRGQNSAEHGSIFSKLLTISEIVVWIKTQWMKFSRNDQPPAPPRP